MATPTTPDELISKVPFHITIGVLMLLPGIGLVYWGHSMAESFCKDLVMTLGTGFITAAVFDLVFTHVLDAFKWRITKRFRADIDTAKRTTEMLDEMLAGVDRTLKSTRVRSAQIEEEYERGTMLDKLKEIALRLEQIEKKLGRGPTGG